MCLFKISAWSLESSISAENQRKESHNSSGSISSQSSIYSFPLDEGGLFVTSNFIHIWMNFLLMMNSLFSDHLVSQDHVFNLHRDPIDYYELIKKKRILLKKLNFVLRFWLSWLGPLLLLLKEHPEWTQTLFMPLARLGLKG